MLHFTNKNLPEAFVGKSWVLYSIEVLSFYEIMDNHLENFRKAVDLLIRKLCMYIIV